MRAAIVGVVLGTLGTSVARADFAVFQGDGSGWFQSVQSWSTITFAEFPANTPIAEQYALLGVHFTDTDGNWISQSPDLYQDGAGLFGSALVALTFDTPMRAFASHFPGQARFDFYLGGVLQFHSAMMGGGGVNFFAGFGTDAGFDSVRIYGNPPRPVRQSRPGVLRQLLLLERAWAQRGAPDRSRRADVAGAPQARALKVHPLGTSRHGRRTPLPRFRHQAPSP